MSVEIVAKSARRWRLGLRLWVVMVLVVPLALWLGRVTNRAREQARGIRTIERAGGSILFDYQRASIRPANAPIPESPGVLWLRRWIGDDYFRSVFRVSFRQRKSELIHKPIAALEAFPSLEVLIFNGVSLTEADLKCVGRLKSLRHLNLVGVDLRGVDTSSLSALKNLTGLTVEGCQIHDSQFKFLTDLSSMETLNLRTFFGHDGVGDEGVSYVSGLVNLKELDLQENTRVSDAGCQSIARLKSLTALNLNGTQVGDSGVAQFRHLTSLTDLQLKDTRVGDEGLKALVGLDQLFRLNVESTLVTKGGVASLQASLPGLEMLLSTAD